MMAQRWIRLYREALHDPKIVTLSDRQHRAWHNCLLIADDAGFLPCMRDVAVHLRLSTPDCEQIVDELINSGLIDIVLIDGPKRLRMHGWEKRQYASDNSTARVRKYRDKSNATPGETFQKRSGNGDVTPPESDSDTDSYQAQTVEQAAVRARRAEQVLNFGSKGKTGGRASPALKAGGLDVLVARAEGFGLDVAVAIETTQRAKPKNPAGYFLTLCVNQLRPRIPDATEATLKAAMRGEIGAQQVVYEALA